ncbi:DUF3575 domain-containing protein [Maribacter sp.]|nr:DUF3575 domain-containing protein [Maribacter sp.]
MKKVLVILISLSSFSAMAQAYPSYENNHEVKLNFGLFLATTTVEASYEYFFTEDTSIGGTLYFDNDGTDYNGNFGIGPNLRAYFGFRPRSGFFAEAFGLYYTGEDEVEEDDLGVRNADYGTTAIGLGIGNKWVTRSERFTLEVHAGLGRNINQEDFQSVFMYRAGLSVGFRF